ncbi:MAG: HipA N-terminal domain-containing protein [Lachnospiraceae bacterium]|nr:HipA N-terminal domain-containing protein [Lachnospiraceae bacterium]
MSNTLYLKWSNPRSRRNYIVGKLTKGKQYEFQYCGDYNLAKKDGYLELKAFPTDTLYTSERLFPTFASRLPDPKRRDIDKILRRYGMKQFDDFELLRKGGAKLPIDTYEFVDSDGVSDAEK